MKMKRYCEEVIKDFIKRDIIKLYEKGSHTLFDMNTFRPSFKQKLYKEHIKTYVGNGIMMYHLVPDVVSFEKDGNILTFKAKEFKEN